MNITQMRLVLERVWHKLKRVKLRKDGLIDLEHLENILEKKKIIEIIGSFTIASNVSGIITC